MVLLWYHPTIRNPDNLLCCELKSTLTSSCLSPWKQLGISEKSKLPVQSWTLLSFISSTKQLQEVSQMN